MSFKGLVEKLERGGKSHEYATKIAGKVANEKRAKGDCSMDELREKRERGEHLSGRDLARMRR